ncbi:F0F1 ATP synthase subunit B [Crossiella sp. CA198]|uniref:F0F1 ATP synthase subunit B n=1 Tax=Crossiella sp. CA198 TaxID=3455607 RepID=UPI003F8D06A3
MSEVSAAVVLAAGDTVFPLGLPLGEIILGLIAFGVVFFVLNKYAFPQFEKAYSARTEAIEGGIARAEQAQAQAQDALQQYKAQLADARAEAARIRDDARAEGQQIVIELREQAQAESERIVAQGQAALAAQRAQIVAELRGDLGRIAVDLAGRVVGESLEDEARRRGTVDRFLDELDATSAPAGK